MDERLEVAKKMLIKRLAELYNFQEWFGNEEIDEQVAETERALYLLIDGLNREQYQRLESLKEIDCWIDS